MDSRTSMMEPGQLGFRWALLISVALHLILLVLSIWTPLTQETAAAVPLEESILQFSFAQPSPEDQAGEQAGEVPFETPPSQQPTQPAEPIPPSESSEASEPDYQAEGDASLAPPQSEIPDPIDEPQDAIEDLAPEAEIEPASEQPTETEPEPSAEMPEDPRGLFRNRRQDDVTPSQPEEAQNYDVNRRLQEFGEALDRARASRPPSESQPRRPSNVFVPEVAAFPNTGFGAGNLVFESRDYDWSEYGRQIYTAIWRAWHNRLYRTSDDFEKWAYERRIWMLAHQSQIRFVIERTGGVTGIALEGASGCVPLDASAMDALAEVILPPLPRDFPRDREVVHARFIANGEIMNIRPVLNQLKRLGYF